MKRIVSLILTAALCAASVFSLVGCAGGDKIENGIGEIWDGVKEGAGEAVEDLISPTSFEMINSDRVSLALLDDATAPSEAVMTATLTATVKPEDATDKTVDWSVYWLENGEGEEALVSDYLTVTPDSDGATNATVKVYKPFPNSVIGIKVTTRVGGYSAECRATYVGKPNAAEIIVPEDLLDDAGRILLAPNTTYSLDLAFTNIFGEVTEEYLAEHADLTCGLVGVGSFLCSGMTSNMVGNFPAADAEMSLDEYKAHFMSCAIVDGKLQITVNKAIQSFLIVKTVSGGDTGLGDTNTIYSYKSGAENCYFILSVTDNNSGVSYQINVRIQVDATDVTLSAGELVF